MAPIPTRFLNLPGIPYEVLISLTKELEIFSIKE